MRSAPVVAYGVRRPRRAVHMESRRQAHAAAAREKPRGGVCRQWFYKPSHEKRVRKRVNAALQTPKKLNGVRQSGVIPTHGLKSTQHPARIQPAWGAMGGRRR